jgi:hypothetical protein
VLVLLSDVDILSAARTVTILFTSDVDLFLAKSLFFSSGRKIGGVRGELVFPSDALLVCWKLDLALDVGLGGYCCFGVRPV